MEKEIGSLFCQPWPKETPDLFFRSLLLIVLASAMAVSCGATPSEKSRPAAARPASEIPHKTFVSFAEVEPLLSAAPSGMPVALSGAREQRATLWPSWVRQHDAEIRARLALGDEDSIVNLWLFGTAFTTLPRATESELARAGPHAPELLERRLGDLIQGATSPGDNERLQFVRQVIERQGIDLSTAAGQDRAWRYLVEVRERANAQNRVYAARAAATGEIKDAEAKQSSLAALFSDRGLSSDTSIAADFGLDRALSEMKAQQRLGAGEVHRAAIVGPGLDFTDKAEGYDFYPLQTIQPFALADSLTQLQLAAPDLTLATFDLSPRVNGHLQAARARARAGIPYVLNLPLERNDSRRQWTPEFEQYWESLGAGIGESLGPVSSPAELAGVRVRRVQIRPAVVSALAPFDLNIVLERLNVDRLTPSGAEAPFDLIVATNVLVYYTPFEQALALSNIAAMLRPGGYLLTNYRMAPVPPFERQAAMSAGVLWDREGRGDTLFAYLRR